MNLGDSEVAMRMRFIRLKLSRHLYRFSSEAGLQDGIANILQWADIKFEREYGIDKLNRFDFWLPEGIVIEVKIDGSVSDALRQVDRYLKLDSVRGVLVASTCAWARSFRISDGYSKNLSVAYLLRNAL